MFLSGEIIFNTIEIVILTKIDSTNIITENNNKIYDYPNAFCKYELFCQPVIQCAITKTQLYNKNLTETNTKNIYFELQKNLLVKHNDIFYLNQKKFDLVSLDLEMKFKKVKNL